MEIYSGQTRNHRHSAREFVSGAYKGPRSQADHGSGHPGHGQGGGLVLEVATKKQALKIIFGPEPVASTLAIDVAPLLDLGDVGATWFKRLDR